jgi:hypothetical protein
VEFDGDGKLDILSGCYSDQDQDPMAGVFWLMKGLGEGQVAAPVLLKGTDGKPLLMHRAKSNDDNITRAICSHPYAVDWDADGDLDILSGNFEGTYFFFRNTGSAEKPSFEPAPTQVMTTAGLPLRIPSAHSSVHLVDWDGDGDVDLLSGSSNGSVHWAENEASGKSEPKFKAMQQLIAPTELSKEEVPPEKAELPKASGSNTRVFASDVNGDGKLDLLVGDGVNLRQRAAGVSEETYRQREKQWQADYEALMKLPSESRNGKFSALWQRRATFLQDESTGFVWLYLRK